MPTRIFYPELELGKARFLRVDNGSEQMNVNGLAPGGTIIVWDGEGTYWTLEGYGTKETYAAKTGSYGLDSGARSAGDETLLSNGSDINVNGLYQNVRFWMKPKTFSPGAIFKVQWRTLGGSNIGNALDVSHYVPNMDLEVWQLVTIPISDFGLTANVAKLVLSYFKGSQKFYFDNFELILASAGGPFTFRITPSLGEKWNVCFLNMVMYAASTGWNSNAFGNIAGGLSQGLILRKKKLSTSEVSWALTFMKNIELFGQLVPSYDFQFADSQLMVNFSMNPAMSSLVLTDDDALEFLVRDNLSSIGDMRAYIHYGKELS